MSRGGDAARARASRGGSVRRATRREFIPGALEGPHLIEDWEERCPELVNRLLGNGSAATSVDRFEVAGRQLLQSSRGLAIAVE
jgi:hypothetical protein